MKLRTLCCLMPLFLPALPVLAQTTAAPGTAIGGVIEEFFAQVSAGKEASSHGVGLFALKKKRTKSISVKIDWTRGQQQGTERYVISPKTNKITQS